MIIIILLLDVILSLKSIKIMSLIILQHKNYEVLGLNSSLKNLFKSGTKVFDKLTAFMNLFG